MAFLTYQFVADGTVNGVVTIDSTQYFKVEQWVIIAAIGNPTLTLEVKRILSSTQLAVGPITLLEHDNIRTDISAYTVLAAASIIQRNVFLDATGNLVTATDVLDKRCLDVNVVNTEQRMIVEWVTKSQFDAGNKINTETAGADENALVRLASFALNNDNISYLNPADYTYDPTKIEVAGDLAQLLYMPPVVGANDFTFDNPLDYVYDPVKITVAGSTASLIASIPSFYTYDWPYTVAGDYTYNASRIIMSGGNAKLLSFVQPHALWHFNEATGATASDSSGHGRNGTLVNMENSDWVSGKLNNCLLFGGTDEYVNCGSIAAFERNQPFSLECWFKTSAVTAFQFLFSKESNSTATPPLRGYALLLDNGRPYFFMSNTVPTNYLYVGNAGLLNNGAWHHLVVTYSGSSTAAGVTFYVDGAVASKTAAVDTLSATILTSANFQISGRDGAEACFIGNIDEPVVYDGVLTAAEVTARYNLGSGSESFLAWNGDSKPHLYYMDTPTVVPNVGFTTGASYFSSFTETSTKPPNTQIKYILSDDNGATWKYWNGASWVLSSGTYAQANTASEINTQISSFPIVTGNLNQKAFLYTVDGVDTPILDKVELGYALMTFAIDNPTIDANYDISDFPIASWQSFVETATKPAATNLKYTLSNDSGVTWLYWDGASWTVADGTYAKSNTAAEIGGNFATFPTVNTKIRIRVFLNSSGISTPTLDNVHIGYLKALGYYSTDENLYIDTKNASRVDPLAIFVWISCLFTHVQPAPTDIAALLSVDGRVTWLGWNGAAWVSPADPTLRSNASSIADIQANFGALPLGDGTLDVRVFLKTSNPAQTPQILNIGVISNAGFKLSGSWETQIYSSGCLDNDWLNAYFTVTAPAGTAATFKYRVGNYTSDMGPYVVFNSGDELLLNGKYIQFKVEFVSGGLDTPFFSWLQTTYKIYNLQSVRP